MLCVCVRVRARLSGDHMLACAEAMWRPAERCCRAARLPRPSQTHRRTRTGPSADRLLQLPLTAVRWARLDRAGPLWTRLDPAGPRWTGLGPAWTRLDPLGPVWTRLDRSGPGWTRLDPAGSGWAPGRLLKPFRCLTVELLGGKL